MRNLSPSLVLCFLILLTLPLACVPGGSPHADKNPPLAAEVKSASDLSEPDPAITDYSDDPNFDLWLRKLSVEARNRGISEATLQEALTGLTPIPQVVTRAESQAEDVFSASRYIARMVSDFRVREGVRHIRENKELLERVTEEYGVQPQYLVALWAIESDFGRGTARFPLIGALATQAYQGRRQDFFRRELMAALTILDEESMKSEQLRGSWAGATGLFQFMPTSYLHYAVDFNDDGHRNIWSDPEDALGSAGHYLAEARWQAGQEWGHAVTLPADFDPALAGLKNRKTLRDWRKAGIKEAKGPDDRKAALLLPDGPQGPAFLVFDNFQVLMRWNRSSSFALAVGHLADRIKAELSTADAKEPR